MSATEAGRTKRMHRCGDGVWRHADQHTLAGQVRMIKLDENGKPTGSWAELGTVGCVHFSYAPE